MSEDTLKLLGLSDFGSRKLDTLPIRVELKFWFCLRQTCGCSLACCSSQKLLEIDTRKVMDFIKNMVIPPTINSEVMDFIIDRVLPPVIVAVAINYLVPRIFNFLKCIINFFILIINSVVTLLLQKSGYLLYAGPNVRDLKEIADKLKQAKQSAKVMHGEQVNEWMKKVQAMEELLRKIEEDYNNMYAINCWTRYRVGKRAVEVVLKMKKLISEQQDFDVHTKKSAPSNRKMFNLPNDMLSSTARCLRTACEYLQDDLVGMVGIWGMGGVGKTTLLQRINDHSVLAAGFDYVIWAVVSQEHNKLQKDIADRVGLTLEVTLTVESRVDALYHHLMTKKFLLLLDDMWEPLELVKLGIPRPSVINKSKVVFTTRSQTVCEKMMAGASSELRCREIEIECLRHEEAWKLFLDSVGEGMRSVINSDKRVCSRAKKVADKCGGLPLALVIIARAMSANKTWQEWEDAINSLNKIGIQEILSNETDCFPLLKVSYDRLPDETVKNCFLRCALWPEDRQIGEFDLISYWLGMNLIDGCGDYTERYMRGFSILQILKRACLLQKVEGRNFRGACVKLHDIIRGMALWIVSGCKKKWMIRNRAKLKKETEDATEWREAELISLMYGRLGALPQHPDCPNLLSLMLWRNCISVVPEGFFQNMHALTFLDLSYNKIAELPQAISGLLRLRHLDLSGNSICSLPMELGNLSELKFLHLNDSKVLRSIPRGLILRLRKLELLMLHTTAFDGWVTEGQASIEELVSSSVTSLGLDIRRFETLEQLSGNTKMSLWVICMRDLAGMRMLPLRALIQVGNTRCTLLRLHIQDCDSLEEISASSECDEGFDNLERLALRNLPALKNITFAGVVPGSLLWNIRYLIIWSCGKLKNATWILLLPHLEALSVAGCPEMQHVICNEEGSSTGGTNEQENLMVFLNLKRVVLLDLPELRSFSTHGVALPSFKYRLVDGCPKLDMSSVSSSAEPSKWRRL